MEMNMKEMRELGKEIDEEYIRVIDSQILSCMNVIRKAKSRIERCKMEKEKLIHENADLRR